MRACREPLNCHQTRVEFKGPNQQNSSEGEPLPIPDANFHTNEIQKAVIAGRRADALVLTAGAGMGVDSGLPDFRGNQGFWNAYPPFKKLGLSFFDLANPQWFDSNPRQAWGFYGHRLNLYKATRPHHGFDILLKWANSKPAGYFVFTSNVDGHFQQAGFHADRVVECHGSFSFLQCCQPCSDQLWASDKTNVVVDESTMLAEEPLPQCPNCGSIARPNILMFGDWNWVERFHAQQREKYQRWFASLSPEVRVTVVEIGAGNAVPTVRNESERRAQGPNQILIRINVREFEGPNHCIPIAMPGLKALQEIDRWI